MTKLRFNLFLFLENNCSSLLHYKSFKCGFQASNQILENAPNTATPQNMLRNLHKVALPAIAFAGASMLQGAHAGPITWAACIAACEATAAAATAATAGAAAPALVACVNGCWPLLPLPFCP